MGVREQIIFPEIDYDAIDQVRGLDMNIATTAANDEEAFALLEAFGMPFQRAEQSAARGPPPSRRRRRRSARPKAEAEQAALEQLKEENPEAYERPEREDETAEGEAPEGAAPAGDEQQGS